MASNAILGYLDLICRTKYSTKHNFFANKKSFDPIDQSSTSRLTAGYRTPPRRYNSSRAITDSPIDISASPRNLPNDLPIHLILKDIYWAILAKNNQYFEPMIIHYWQLLRLLEILRCNTKLLSLRSKQGANFEQIEQLRKEIADTHPDLRHTLRAREQEIQALERSNAKIQSKLNVELVALRNGQRPQDQENLQAVLVLSTLLNVIFRHGMSVPALSDQFNLEEQQHECKDLLGEYCGIVFDNTEPAFTELFRIHPNVQTVKTIPERIGFEITGNWMWIWGNWPAGELGLLATNIHYVSRVLGINAGHAFYNHFRNGGSRIRRLLVFLEPYLQNETYSEFCKTVDPYLSFAVGYINCIFFIPRLLLHFSVFDHHLRNDSQLEPLERKISLLTRFRAHWTRFGFEFITDSYWFLGSLKLFFVPGGSFSPVGIIIGLAIQLLDLFGSVVKAIAELRRLSNMAADLNELESNLALKKDMNKRFWFEAFALGYMVFHFAALTLSLCLTLPSMAAVSTMLPVVGGTCAILLTIATFYMQDYFTRQRETKFECRPEPFVAEENPRPPVVTGMTPRFSRYF